MVDKSKNKTIAKNTIYLYIRMIFIMVVNLYVVRSFLDLLGVEDYGIYNVVGGVVGMLAFLNGTLATSTQRYFSIALTNDNIEQLNKQFRLNVSVFIAVIIVALILSETLGLWYVNTKATIPENRLFAANIVYQFSIISFILQLISVPYNALIIAHEQMKTFAYVGVCEAFFKLVIVITLIFSSYDQLIVYGFMVMTASFLVTLSYYCFCNINYPESKYTFYWNNQEAKDVIVFSGWHFLGTLSVAIRSQGINLLINSFFSPIINAARAVAFQIESAILQLSGNFFVAVKPQIYKTYALNEIEQFKVLINRSTIICVFLVSIISIPFMINVDFILEIWLKEVPAYTVSFTLLVLINGLVDSTGNPTICAALATKEIKEFYIVTGFLYIITLPISYFFLKAGYNVLWTMYITIGLSIVTVFARAFILRKLIGFDIVKYTSLLLKLLFVTLVIAGAGLLIKVLIENIIIAFFATCFLTIVLHVTLYPIIVLTKTERILIFDIIKKKYRKQ